MNDRNRPKPQLRRFAAIALLACTVYQLGACSCGCLEHNMWISFFGWNTHEYLHAGVDDESANLHSTDHDHDCTGEAKARYLDNSIAVTDSTLLSTLAIVRAVAPPVALNRRADGKQHRQPKPPERCLSTLQVFLL